MKRYLVGIIPLLCAAPCVAQQPPAAALPSAPPQATINEVIDSCDISVNSLIASRTSLLAENRELQAEIERLKQAAEKAPK
jgi:hypothetical protein